MLSGASQFFPQSPGSLSPARVLCASPIDYPEPLAGSVVAPADEIHGSVIKPDVEEHASAVSVHTDRFVSVMSPTFPLTIP